MAPLAALRRLAAEDHRHPQFNAHVATLLDSVPPPGLCLSVGGGPGRPHPRLTNLNIAPFANVDIVGDAHALPFAGGSVGGVYCEAVLEHLEDPNRAVAEMLRVLRPGGLALAATPFLQAFHGYPSHFQNFTTEGHRLLFARAGFEVLDCGPCVGPAYVVTSLVSTFLAQFPPRLLRLGDRWLVRHPRAAMLCSTTYVLARKPAAAPN
ncbi:class I SAM-dependent methyltransferase [Paracraurococcus ruber]|uniref:Methyltransferase type 11 domain-containing protein n=1 Tax=Paracraurococcus ruber TaxID=77675 RepID=A0ABS1D4A8_9PROT|nr:class I SAM-dependent methyltransferase [Paracraurococcus ruber]MBK1660917.1 hypothetical protein [Paracraurococcus ruber]TDG30458.1 methyltransferase domain-containing protein [Paracraurococcus ruber]